mmetsp:Transcript_32769/g.79586  ORF Transcript_32769/g.79586 Transcript_32769/m.79586 type:complete len:209 (-) Transcript_32769:239-865(-)
MRRTASPCPSSSSCCITLTSYALSIRKDHPATGCTTKLKSASHAGSSGATRQPRSGRLSFRRSEGQSKLYSSWLPMMFTAGQGRRASSPSAASRASELWPSLALMPSMMSPRLAMNSGGWGRESHQFTARCSVRKAPRYRRTVVCAKLYPSSWSAHCTSAMMPNVNNGRPCGTLASVAMSAERGKALIQTIEPRRRARQGRSGVCISG